MSYVRRQKATGPDFGVRLKVVGRDDHACVICLASVVQAVYSLHHRRPRGMGGTSRPDSNQPQNLLTVCGSGLSGCHGRIESNRAEAMANGWLLPQGADPLRHAVLVRRQSRWVYLTADAEYADNPPVEAA